jgi:hypothetical protein
MMEHALNGTHSPPAVVHDAPLAMPVAFSMVEKLMANPDISMERVEQAFAFYQRVQADLARQEFFRDFAVMQPALPVIEKRGTLKTNEKQEGKATGKQVAMSKYARWEDIVDGIRDVMAKHGFALSFKIDQPTEARVSVTATLSHRGGHTESTAFALPIDTSGAKNNVQGWASSVSYAKRYTGCALLNIVARGEDDDGQAASDEDVSTISEAQQAELSRLISATGSDSKKFLEVARAEGLWDVMAKDFPKLKAMLVSKMQKAGAK